MPQQKMPQQKMSHDVEVDEAEETIIVLCTVHIIYWVLVTLYMASFDP